MKFEITVVHKFERIDEILAAIEKIAHPPLPEIKQEPEPQKPAYLVEFERWIASSGFTESQASHYAGALKVLLKQAPCPPGHSRATLRDELARHGAPLPEGL